MVYTSYATLRTARMFAMSSTYVISGERWDYRNGLARPVSLSGNTDMRRLMTGIRSEKCVGRQFRRCANTYLHKPR